MFSNKKYQSAVLCVKFYSELKEYSDVQIALDQTKPIEDYKIENMFTLLEGMALYHRQGIIRRDHIYNQFGDLLQAIRSNEQTQRLLAKWQQKDDEYFEHIIWLLGVMTK